MMSFPTELPEVGRMLRTSICEEHQVYAITGVARYYEPLNFNSYGLILRGPQDRLLYSSTQGV